MMNKNTNQTQFVAGLTAAMSPNSVTQNGAIARSTTGSAVLNLFSQIGGCRGNVANASKLTLKAYEEDPDLTARCVFYSRDPRGGQGEREIFRSNMKALIQKDLRFKKLVDIIPVYGRWDDVVSLIDYAEYEVITSIKNQLVADLASEHPSLLAKWLPSENASSQVSSATARRIRSALKLSSKEYRKMLSALRAKIGIVESLMSSGKWNDIDFGAVPSNAMLIYRKAFGARAPEKFSAYMESVKKGEAKINAGVLFPYDLVSKYSNYGRKDDVVEAQWKALPDYFNGVTENSIVVADVSGSMQGLPMDVSISLALYIAERNKGEWHNKFITFSSTPMIQSIMGNSLFEKVQNLSHAHWNMSTNIEAVFRKIFDVALKVKMNPADMIKRVYIVSDMEFDAATNLAYRGASSSLFQDIREMYETGGYTLPEIVFWNVSAKSNQVPMAMDERGFLNVSGCSPSIFKYILGKEFISAYEMMLDVLNSEKYGSISVTK